MKKLERAKTFYQIGVFSMPTYEGLLEGSPRPLICLHRIEELKKVGAAFSWLDPYVHTNGIDPNVELLPKMSYIAWVSSTYVIPNGSDEGCGSHALIMWFDKGDLEINASMQRMLKEIDWDSIASNFDY